MNSKFGKHDAYGTLLLLATALGWATTGLFVRLLPSDTSPALVAASRSIGGGGVTLLMLLFSSGTNAFEKTASPNRPWAMIAAGLSYVFTVGLFLAALQRADTGAVFALHYTAPAFTCLFGILFGWEKPRAADLAVLIAVGLGSACFFLDRTHAADGSGLWLALLSGVAWGLSLPLTKRLDRDGRLLAMLTAHSLLIAWGLVAASGRGAALLSSWPVHLGMALVSSAIPNVLYLAALARVKSPLRIGLLLLTEPVAAAILGMILLDEHPSPLSLSGYALLGVAIIAQLSCGRAKTT